jgi:NAD+ kinase
MKIIVYGKKRDEITDLVKKIGFKIIDPSQIKNQFDGAGKPDVIASYGGDGTFMKAEAKYPGIPKFIVKRSETCKKGHNIPKEELLKKVFSRKYIIEKEMKISACFKGHPSQIKNQFDGAGHLVGLNEIVVHNFNPRRAIRYEFFVNDKKIGGQIIGDGVIVATPFGSTGYYRSIADGFFEIGIGVAFNNSTEQSDHMVLKENSIIKIKIIRGPALVYADNGESEILLEDNDEIIIKRSATKAKIVKVL